MTNSIRHAQIPDGQSLRLDGRLLPAVLRFEVWDAGTHGAVTRRPPRRGDDVGGFGLDLVTHLSNDWGVERDAHGTTVWLELPTSAEHLPR